MRNYRYDDAGQLTDLHDNRRGDINYRYDPLGRLLGASSQHKEETFAFDPASNLLDPKAPRRPIHHPPPKLLDNLLRDYVGQHYTYDARGNLLERLDNGKKARFTWDLYDRLTRYEDDRLTADFAYDALGRRVAKYSKAHCPPSPGAGPAWIEQQQRTLNAQYDCGQNIYGWDGDTLAYETRYSDNPGERRLIHYFYEPGSFIPVAQTVENRNLSLVREPSHENGYHIDRDPLWQHQPVAKPFNAMAWYQCDHLGTPMELTDQRGEIAWSGTYQAWGLAKEKRTDSATRENIRNPLRFQGQYFDTETGLHYNRYRYYDPQVGRFISKDPIGFAGGLNVYAYAPNPVGWVDPFGLESVDTLKPGPFAVESIPAHRGRPTSEEQRQVNGLMKKYGCHTCGTSSTGTKSGNAIADHQPPQALGEPEIFLPHCNTCKARQGGQVLQEKRRRSKR
ncbi:RHS repeat-associated core domain-containing protein [Pseudomonas helleri]|uniref:RHS repeat-associated core domain-containing protein n=1 Tax=Pseudomonas helleri TaxID=1608996 RepID=UPI00188604D2